MHGFGADEAGEPGDLAGTALVEPDDGGPYGGSRRIQGNEGLALIGDGDGGDAPRVDLLEQAGERLTGGAPPVFAILLIAIVAEAVEWDGRASGGCHSAIALPGDGFGGGGAAIDSHHQIGGRRHGIQYVIHARV